VESFETNRSLTMHYRTDVVVLFPFKFSLPIPRVLWDTTAQVLVALRVIPPRRKRASPPRPADSTDGRKESTLKKGKEKPDRLKVLGRSMSEFMNKHFFQFRFTMDFVIAPLIADLFLLAILAIGAQEVRDGTVGTSSIFPIDVMAFFLTLAYIAISLDASGLIRWLAFKVLQRSGHNGKRLYLYLYIFFYLLACVVGNDPVILSGTAFLAYMIRVSDNIKQPKAWLHTQFAVANIGSAILVSSNPTNLVLASAFNIKFITYSVNMIVPTMVTAVVLYPLLRWIIFPGENLVPSKITLRTLPESMRRLKAINPNIPHAALAREGMENVEELRHSGEANDRVKLLMLEAIMNPFLDKGGAIFGSIIIVATLLTIIIINAKTDTSKEHPVYWVTLPAAFVMFCWDLGTGWVHRKKTKEIAKQGRKKTEEAQRNAQAHPGAMPDGISSLELEERPRQPPEIMVTGEEPTPVHRDTGDTGWSSTDQTLTPGSTFNTVAGDKIDEEKGQATAQQEFMCDAEAQDSERMTLVSLCKKGWWELKATFPTVTAVIEHLPFKLVPFALSMFVLVQALATKGWIAVFAYGWDHWVNKTGTIGAIGGMAFISVIMCNVWKAPPPSPLEAVGSLKQADIM
jgi:Na+/H+ antiporter NhaD/arsenite permease-like protein